MSFLLQSLLQKIAPVDHTINNNPQMKIDDMVSYHKFSNRTDQQVHEKLRKKIALAKGYSQLVNELNHYNGRNSVQNSSIRGYQESSVSAALSEHCSRLVAAKIQPSIVTKVVSFTFKTKKFCCEHVSLML